MYTNNGIHKNVLSTKDEKDEWSHFSFLKKEILMWRDVILNLGGQDMLRSLCCGRSTVHAYFCVAQPQPLNSEVCSLILVNYLRLNSNKNQF